MNFSTLLLLLSLSCVLLHSCLVTNAFAIFPKLQSATKGNTRNSIAPWRIFVILGGSVAFCNPNICVATTATITPTTIKAIVSTTDESQKQLSWMLSNGQVKLSNPLMDFPHKVLRDPTLLGSGGGGAVFALNEEERSISSSGKKKDDEREVALKISWIKSAQSVERECMILNRLEEQHVRNVEHCLGIVPYPDDSRRVMIVLEPVVHESTASVRGLDESKQADSVRSIMKTLVDMLSANVVTTDVQVLIDKFTGKVTFIDMTEAQIMSKPPTFLEIAQASSFCSEMFALVPESLIPIAITALKSELNSDVTFPNEVIHEILQDAILSY